MKACLPILYSPVDESGFSFHIRTYAKKTGKKISINRIARLWWIARNSPYLSIKEKGKYVLDEVKLVRRSNALNISDKVIKDDLAILRSAGILIEVITNDRYLLASQYRKQNAELIAAL